MLSLVQTPEHSLPGHFCVLPLTLQMSSSTSPLPRIPWNLLSPGAELERGGESGLELSLGGTGQELFGVLRGHQGCAPW